MAGEFGVFGTHVPILVAAVARTTGPVLELGMGEHSTPPLHYMCQGRFLLSGDNDAAWLARFRGYANHEHQMEHVTNWAAWSIMDSREWSVVLVDQHPGDRRSHDIDRLRSRSRFIVVHDTETDYNTGADYKYEPIFSKFKYRADFRRFRPYTTVVSDFEAFRIEECDRIWKPE